MLHDYCFWGCPEGDYSDLISLFGDRQVSGLRRRHTPGYVDLADSGCLPLISGDDSTYFDWQF